MSFRRYPALRPLILLLLVRALSLAQSYPSAWNYVAPDATALIGINWQHLQKSFLYGALNAELSAGGRLGFPGLDCLRDAKEILLSGPDLLGVISGRFPPSTVALQATALKMKPADYDGIRLWIAPGPDQRSIAQVSETIILVGYRETLEGAIDRTLTIAAGHPPLLARGAHLAAGSDLWISAEALPDPLVSVLLPLEFESGNFDGGVSVSNGLVIDARYEMSNTEDAESSAGYFRQAVAGFHALLQSMKVIVDGSSVRLKLRVSAGELAQHLR